MAITSIKTGSSFTNLVKYNDFLAGNPAFSPSSYESIASATGTGSSNTIIFSSIPSTYASLQIRINGKSTYNQNSSAAIIVRANGSSATDYSYHFVQGYGTGVQAGGYASQTEMWLGAALNDGAGVSSMMGVTIIDVHDYASTTKNKTFRSFSGEDRNTTSSAVYLFSGAWLSTSAITSLSVIVNDGSWNTSSTVSLYGIKGA